MFIYCHIDNEKMKNIKKSKNLKNSEKKLKKNSRKNELKIGHHFMTFHFTTCHSYLMLHGEMLFSRLYPRIKNG